MSVLILEKIISHNKYAGGYLPYVSITKRVLLKKGQCTIFYVRLSSLHLTRHINGYLFKNALLFTHKKKKWVATNLLCLLIVIDDHLFMVPAL